MRSNRPILSFVIADSSSTGNYISITTLHHNRQISTSPISIEIPDGGTIQSSHTCNLYLPHLHPGAPKANIFPQFPAGALLSISLLCNHRYIAILSNTSIQLNLSRRTILQGTTESLTVCEHYFLHCTVK